MYSRPLMFFSCQPFLQVSYRSWTGRLQLLPTVIKPVDLVVLGQCPGDDSDGVGWLRPDDVMIDAGRPVLIVPCAGTF